MISNQELAQEIRNRFITKTFKFAYLPTRLNCGKVIWLTNYFSLHYISSPETVRAKVSLQDMVEIQYTSTQGTPESKSAGGGYYHRSDEDFSPRRRRSSYQSMEEEFEQTFEESYQHTGRPSKPKNYEEMKSSILANIIGQDQIIEEVMNKMVRRDFKLSTDKKKPLSFFWAGPTGVGKTETALQLGKVTNLEVVRIDMSEYTHDHNIARLIGSPPGYVGFNQPGILQECDGKECILLIDEIEKAHNLVYNIFLQIMDYGVLTDGRNRQVDLTKTIIIMTSNVGAREMNETKIGISQHSTPVEKKTTVMSAMSKTFAPEFINRLSSVMVFNSLEFAVIENIVKMNVNKVLEAVEKEYGVKVELSDSLKSDLLKRAYNPTMGVRPIHRAIESLILEPLSVQIVAQKKSGKICL